MNRTINRRLLEREMLKRGLNQAQVARSLGVSREAVSRWFRTGSLPKPATLVALGDLLQLPVETIVVSSEVKVRLGGRRVVGEAPSEYMATAIVLYEQPEGGVRIDVKLQNDTLWLNLNQIADLFGRDKSVISRHLRNIYDEGELARESTVASFATVQSEGARQVERQTEFYNLDAILSVGYRVNSKRGTQFRLWATSVLRDHIVKGYTVNARRLKELNQVVRLIADMAGRRALEGEEATALLRLAADYSFALELLDDYDHQRVAPAGVTRDVVYPVDYEEAVRIVGRLRERYGAGDLFGREKDNSLQSALGAVVQSFGGRDVYPTLEEKAANLLYFLVKNHPFVDGNKRIGAALFLWFMDKNGALCRADGSKRLADTALVAMVLLIAESKPSEKDLLCRVLVHLIVRGDG